jgi:large subunit ribosomal protein L35
MPKAKTNKSAAKRIKMTASGRFKRNRPMKGHLKSTKSPKRRRHLRKAMMLDKSFEKIARRLLGH